jgi:hypothetical protein
MIAFLIFFLGLKEVTTKYEKVPYKEDVLMVEGNVKYIHPLYNQAIEFDRPISREIIILE